MKTPFIFSFLLLITWLQLSAQTEGVSRIEQLTTKDGLSHRWTTCVHQDARGYFWIGTYDGLNPHLCFAITHNHFLNTQQMKTLNFLATITLFCMSLQFAQAQTTATWQGGQPGQSTNWSCNANWKEGRVPDEFSLVVIPADRNFYPVVKSEVMSIDALVVESGATLTLKSGADLSILNETSRVNGLLLMGTIQNDGNLEINNYDEADLTLQHMKGNGNINASTSNITLK